MLEDYMMFMGPSDSPTTKIHPADQLYHKFTTKQWNKKKKKNRKIASKSRKLNRKK